MITLNDAVLNKVVTPVVEAYSNDNYVARKIAPVVPVASEDFAYRVWDSTHMRYVKTVVGPRGKAVPLDVNMAWASDRTEDHFGELFIPERILQAGEKEAIRFATEEAELAAETMLIEEEYDLATTFTTAGTWTNKATPTTKWNSTGGNPGASINTGIEAIRTAIGRFPNTLMMTPDVFRELVTDHVRSADGFGAQGSYQAILDYFGADCLKQLIVCSAIYDSSKKGQTKSLAGIWGTENVWLGFVNASASRSAPSLASTFVYRKGSYTEGDLSKNPKGQMAYMHRNYKQKVRNETAGYYLYNVLA